MYRQSCRIQELIYDVRKAIERSDEAVLSEEINSISRAADRFFNGFALVREGRQPLPELEGIEPLIGALFEARRALNKQRDRSVEWESLSRRSGEIADELEVFRCGDLKNYVSWIERRGRGIFLEACPIDVSGMLSEQLFARIPSCVLTSATLTVGDSFTYMRTRIGLTEGRELALATEFNVRKQALLYIPNRMPD